MEKNFWRKGDFSLFTVPYVYVDHSTYLADALFAQRKIMMKIKGEMAKDESPYRIVFCKVLKRDSLKFEEALGKLGDKMLLLGHTDYPKVCDEIAKMIDEETKAKKRKGKESGNKVSSKRKCLQQEAGEAKNRY